VTTVADMYSISSVINQWFIYRETETETNVCIWIFHFKWFYCRYCNVIDYDLGYDAYIGAHTFIIVV